MSNIDETYFQQYKWEHLPETKYQPQLDYLLKYRAEVAKNLFETGNEETTKRLKEIINYINEKIKELLAL